MKLSRYFRAENCESFLRIVEVIDIPQQDILHYKRKEKVAASKGINRMKVGRFHFKKRKRSERQRERNREEYTKAKSNGY